MRWANKKGEEEKKRREGCRNRLKGKIKQIGYYVSSTPSVSLFQTPCSERCWSVVESFSQNPFPVKWIYQKQGVVCSIHSTLRSKRFHVCCRKVEGEGEEREKSEKEDEDIHWVWKGRGNCWRSGLLFDEGSMYPEWGMKKMNQPSVPCQPHLMLCICAVCVVHTFGGVCVWREWMKEPEGKMDLFRTLGQKERRGENEWLKLHASFISPLHSCLLSFSSLPAFGFRLHATGHRAIEHVRTHKYMLHKVSGRGNCVLLFSPSFRETDTRCCRPQIRRKEEIACRNFWSVGSPFLDQRTKNLNSKYHILFWSEVFSPSRESHDWGADT